MSMINPNESVPEVASVKLPKNPWVSELIARLNAKGPGRSDFDVARELTRDDEAAADDLLRQPRRFPHLRRPRA